MKINVEYTDEMIRELIKKDIEKKIVISNKIPEIDLKVRSKQNYRENEFERGELKCVLTLEVN